MRKGIFGYELFDPRNVRPPESGARPGTRSAEMNGNSSLLNEVWEQVPADLLGRSGAARVVDQSIAFENAPVQPAK
jgi:hypothetical protein